MRHTELAARLAAFNKPVEDSAYQSHLDSWANTATGLGTSRDKVSFTGFAVDPALPFTLLEQLYHNDDVAARICDLLPETALRDGFIVEAGLLRDMNALGVTETFEQAWIFGRLYGGAAVIVGMPGGTATPGKGTVSSLLVVDRQALVVHSFYTDVTSPKYGRPETYRISRPQFGETVAPSEVIHETRVIVFPGARTSPRKRVWNGHWDDSVLQRVYSIVQAYGITWASIVHLLQDAAQGVYSMKDLWNMIAGGNKDIVQERMALVDETRAVSRSILVDADNEDFKRVPTPFSGIPELVDRMSERLASAAGYPLTILMGSSPAGMNATGKSDLEIFYGRVQKQQRKVLVPAIQQLAALMGHDGVEVKFPKLWIPSDEEIAKTRYGVAQADNLYVNDGVVTTDEVRAARFGPEGWSPDMKVTGPAPKPPDPAAAGAGAAADPGGGAAVGSRRFSQKYGR